MSFVPYIENRKEWFRPCNCGRDHQIKIVQGLFHYGETHEAIFCAGLVNHQENRHVWISFVVGDWPNTGETDCYVTADVWLNREGQTMRIEDSNASPFDATDVAQAYPVTRDQVLAVDGAKEWIIDTYLSLFEQDEEINSFLRRENV